MEKLGKPTPFVMLTLALALGGCGNLIPFADGSDAGKRDRTASAPARPDAAPRRIASAPTAIVPNPRAAACISDLSHSGARFSALPDSYDGPGCSTLGTVQLSALSGDNSQFGVSNIGPVQCQTAKTFSAWARFGVDRAARQILGSPLARIETFGSYSCRNIAGSSRRSAHATAEAIDVAAFVLADGRRISLKNGWHGGSAAEREFLRVVHKSACKRFGTVLGPDYNRAHEDHFHLEGTGARYCR